MEPIEIGVVVICLVLIVFVIWYFFGERETVSATVGQGGVQEIDIKIHGGYAPDVITVRKGVPVRLNFFRDETDSCSEQIMFTDFGIARHLQPFETTTIEFTPQQHGEFTFTCGMKMMRGKLIVE
jgi:plastocyanin domain-containing protein